MNEHLQDTKSGQESAVSADTLKARQTRRRFVRGSAVSGAVLLTLRNRAAYAQDTLCISENVWLSYSAGNASAVARHGQEVEDFENAWNTGNYDQVPGPVDDGEICLVPKETQNDTGIVDPIDTTGTTSTTDSKNTKNPKPPKVK